MILSSVVMQDEQKDALNGLIEDCMVNIIRSHYKNSFTENDARQWSQILQHQFADGHYAELGGGIFHTDQGLEYRLVKTKKSQEIEEALDKFVTGKNATIGILLTYAEEQRKRVNAQVGFEHRQTKELQEVCDLLATSIGDKKEARQALRSLYEMCVLGTIYSFSLFEVGFGEDNFLGTFHTHPSGNPPSRRDCEASKILHFPTIVMAATSEFQETGLTLYLVHSQGYEELFKGKLPEEL